MQCELSGLKNKIDVLDLLARNEGEHASIQFVSTGGNLFFLFDQDQLSVG